MINKKNFKTFEELQEFTIENKDFIKIINIERVYEDREITNHVYYNSFIGYDLYFENKKEKIEDYLGVGIEKATTSRTIIQIEKYLKEQYELEPSKREIDITEYNLLSKELEIIKSYDEILGKRKIYMKEKRRSNGIKKA